MRFAKKSTAAVPKVEVTVNDGGGSFTQSPHCQCLTGRLLVLVVELAARALFPHFLDDSLLRLRFGTLAPLSFRWQS